MKRLLRTLLAFGAALLLAAAAPGLLYLGMLGTIQGRPQPGATPPLSVEQQNWLRCELAAGDEARPSITNPWQLALHFLREDTTPGYGDKLAWIVAHDYAGARPGQGRGAEGLSGAALFIWVARHWSTPQLESRAHELLRQAHHFQCTPGPAEWPAPAPSH